MIPLDETLWEDEEKVTAVDNETLINPFSQEEVKNALFAMEKTRLRVQIAFP